MTLPRLLTTARRFVDGVCALPRIALLATREAELEQENVALAERFRAILRDQLGVIDAQAIRRILAGENSVFDLRSTDYEDHAAEVRTLEDETDELRSQLAAEREAHVMQLQDYDRCIAQLNSLREHNTGLEEKLAAARADLEALTRWRLQSEEPCPVLEERVDYSRDGTTQYGSCRTTNLDPENYYRHTPESLAAWKAREGGTDV